jgi:predicted membrane-bound spermidine synthase
MYPKSCIGFTFSMIWAHAPIILPLVLNIKQNPYHPILRIGWAVFQISLLGRVLSTLLFNLDLRSWFGVVNGWSILLLFGMMAIITGIKIVKSHSMKNKSSIQEFV